VSGSECGARISHTHCLTEHITCMCVSNAMTRGYFVAVTKRNAALFLPYTILNSISDVNLKRSNDGILIQYVLPFCRSWGSSVSIVSDCRLDDRGSISGRDKGISSSLCVQISSEAHPASHPMGIRGPLPGGKARLDADHSSPSSVEVKNDE
jgi:hypothetical protein